jgi:hypothetical protein
LSVIFFGEEAMPCDVLRQYDRQTPSFCTDILRKFGQNDYGQNIYRVVWSESVFELIGGMWEERANPNLGTSVVRRGNMLVDTNPVIAKRPAYKLVSKYPDYKGKEGRWILEKWLPCSFSRATWDDKFLEIESGLHLSGPYPEHGEYWCSKVITDRGAYVEPTADLIEIYARQIAAADEYPAHAKREAYAERQARKQREYDNRFDAIFHDCMPAGGVTKLFQAVSGPKTNRKSVDDVKIAPVPKKLRGRTGHSQL